MDTSLAGVNKRVFKEPLGFIRVLQLPLSILAFATTASYLEVIAVPFTCTKQDTKGIEFGYPFDLTSIKVASNFCATSYAPGTIIPFMYGATHQSQFFVATGVLSFLYILTALAIYVLSWATYKKDPRYPMGDFAITAVLAVFWFIGSCAWASGLTLVKTVTVPEVIGERLRGPKGSFPCNVDPTIKMCTPTLTWNYAALNISLIVGFACCGLWVANLWFIYKETIWYKNRMGAMGVVAPPGSNPSQTQFGVNPGHPGMMVPPTGPGGVHAPPVSDYQY